MSSLLSRRQRDFLQAIYNLTRARGYPPTMREIAAAVGNVAGSTSFYMAERLQRRGMVHRDSRIPRSLILTERGADAIRERA